MPGEEYLLALGHLPADNEETSQAGPKTLFSVYFRRPVVFKKTLVYHFIEVQFCRPQSIGLDPL
jgi:hypothetical protein